MEDTLVIDGRAYITAHAAARILGYDRSYIARLCRHGNIVGRHFNKRWLVDLDSLNRFITEHAERKALWQSRLSQELKAVPPRTVTPAPQAQSVLALSSQPSVATSTSTLPRETWHTKRNAHVVASIALTCAVALTFAISQIDSARFATQSLDAPASIETDFSKRMTTDDVASPRALFAAVNESSSGSWISRTLCSWFSLCLAGSSALTSAAHDRTYEPVVVFEKSQTPPSSSPAQPVPSASAPRVVQNITQPVIERIIERVTSSAALAGSYVSEALFNTSLSDLESRLNQRIGAITLSGGGSPAYIGTFGVSQKIDQLDGVDITGGTITGATITGGSITATALSGTLATGSGGTGTTSAPSYGQLLLGNSGGTYDLVATSSLGITASGGSGASFGQAFELTNSTTLSPTTTAIGIGVFASSTIGGGTQTTGLTVSGGATTTGVLVVQGTAASSTFAAGVAVNGLRVSSNGITIANLTNCSEALETDSSGTIICGSDATAAGAANDFTFATNYGVTTAATSSPLWAQNGVFASSTSHFVNLDWTAATSTGLSYFLGGIISSASSTVNGAFTATGNTSLQSATTTNLAITNLASTLLKTNSLGSIIPAVLGADYVNYAWPFTVHTDGVSTSTRLILTNGYLSQASSTVGGATQATGLTIAGGATTTGTLRVEGSATSTFAIAGVSATAIDTTSGTASSTMRGLRVASGGLQISTLDCSAANRLLQTDASGNVICGDDDSGSSASYPFALAGNATSTLTQFNGGIAAYASSTIGNGTAAGGLTIAGTATTTNAVITSVASSLLKTNSIGQVTAAVLGTDYVTYAWPFAVTGYGVSTSTTVGFTNGILSSASSTFTSTLTLSALANGGLAVNSAGQVYKGATTTYSGGLTYGNGNVTLDWPFPNNATTTALSFNGGITTTNASTSDVSANTLAVGQTATTTVSSAGALFTPTLAVGTLTGPLQAVNGLVSASSSLSDFYVSDALTISVGSINSTPIGASSASTAIFTNATTGNATSTSLFATTASSTNLFTSSFTLATLSGFLKATAGAVSTALVNLATDITGILPVGNGGTGWAAIQSGAIPYGAGGGALATTSAGSAGQVLALLGGVPAWTATTTFSGGLTYSGGNVTNTGVTTLLGTANQITASGPTGAVTLSLPSLVSLTQASTTRLSVFDILYVGGSATTTIRGDNLASTLPYASSTAITVSGTGYFGTASTSNLTLSSIRDSLLKTGATGIVAAAVAGTDYATPSQISSAYPFPVAGNATTTLTQFNAGVTAYASSTIGNSTQAGGLTISGGATTTGFLVVQGTAASSTFAAGISATAIDTTSGTASSTMRGLRIASGGLQISTLTSCAEALETDTNGNVVCGTDATATGAANDFTFTANYGVTTAATSSPLWAQNGVFASSTSHFVNLDWNAATSTGLSYFLGGLISSASSTVNGAFTVSGNTSLQSATTTSLAITNLASTLLKTNSLGSIIPAVLGTDYVNFGYLFPSNATTTALSFNGGLTTTNASTSAASANTLAVGGSATTTISSAGALFTPTLTVATLTGPLQAIAGLVSASSSLSDVYISNALTISSSGTVDSTALTDGGTISFDWVDDEVADNLTISAGTINNTPIGASTPNTAIFTIATSTGKLSSYTFVEAPYFSATSTTASTFPYASSTAVTVSGIGYFGTASTSNLTLSSIRDSLLKTGSTGIFAAAVAGTDYATPSQISSAYPFPVAGNATSTLTQFNGGITSFASSTVGSGTQAGGLTVSGGATTTANLLVQGSATTTNLAITNLASTLLKTNTTGGIIPAVLGTDYVSYAWPFTVTGYGVSTSTTAGFTNGLLSTASSTFTSALRLPSLSNGQLNVGAGGLLYSGASTTFSGGLTYSNGNVTMDWMFPSNATSTAISFNGGITTTNASTSAVSANTLGVGGTGTTSIDTAGNLTTRQATTTNLAISNIASGNILKTTTGGAVVPAVSGTDYATPAQISSAYPFPVPGNATTTLTQFNGGITALASSTVGGGTQASGLTISGGATTTGNLIVQGAGTSTFAAGISATALDTTSATSTMRGLRLASNGLTISTLTSSLLKTDASGNVVAAVAGTDYQTFGFPFTTTTFGLSASNATSTLIGFTAGLYSQASSTIGGGTQAGGLTIFGGATTTGNAVFSSNVTVSGNISLQSATTTNLAITNLASTLLRTNATGGIIPAVLGTDYVNYAWPFAVTGYGVSTSTIVGFTNGLLSTASSTFTSALRLSSLSNGQLNVGAGGLLYSGASTTFSGGLTYSNGNVTMDWMFPSNATTSILNFTNGLLSASTTVNGNLVVVGNSTTTNATTTNFAISNIASGNILKTTTGGAVIPAVSGTDYATPSQIVGYPFPVAGNATTTLTQFNGGITAYASSTIGNSTQAGGLTISGGATTTGALRVEGTSTSTFANAGISATAIDTTSGTASSTMRGLRIASGGLQISNLTSCAEALETDANGNIVCGTDATGSGAAFPFTTTTAFGGTVNATSTTLQLTGGLYASSTVRFGNAGVSPFFFDGAVGSLGLGTTTPWAQLSVNPNGISGPSFVVGSSTATNFIVTQAGRVGIGTTSPMSSFAVEMTTGPAILSQAGSQADYLRFLSPSSPSNNGWAFRIRDLAEGDFGIRDLTANAYRLYINSSGNVGIGTTTPASLLSIAGTSGIFASTTATSTFQGGGINLITAAGNTGCFAVNGTCVGSNASDYQEFTADGTWTKPTGFDEDALVYIEAWGGGGSGGKGASNAPCGGGGGGAYNYSIRRLADMGATETVTVGTGGAAQTSASTAGNRGATTTLGSYISASGGGGGACNASGGGGGGGGGIFQAGLQTANATGGNGGAPLGGAGGSTIGTNGGENSDFGGGGGGAGDASGGSAVFGGGGGGGGRDATSCTITGGTSLWGGGGGGGGSNGTSACAGGTSTNGGSGSAGAFDANASSAGTQPSGGSGGTEGGNSGAGGAGQVRVRTIGGADIAENYHSVDPLVAAGDIVSFSDTPIAIKRAVRTETNPIAGVISTNPEIILGPTGVGQQPVALSGRVPVKFSDENGAVAVGDRITISSTPGVGMKAGPFDDSVGIVIGQVEKDANGNDTVMIFLDLQQGIDIEAVGDVLLGNAATTTATSTDATSTTSATSTGTTTPVTSVVYTHATKFVRGIFNNIIALLADANNGIAEFFAQNVHAENVYADTVNARQGTFEVSHTKKLCVTKSDGTEICLTGDELSTLINPKQSGTNALSSSLPSGTTTPANDNTAPVITLNGNASSTVPLGSTYVDLGASVTDDHDQNLGIHFFLNGAEVQQVQLDTSTTTTYSIQYRATDTAGLTATTIRTVTIGAPANDPGTTSSQSEDTYGAANTPPTDATSTPEASAATTPANDNPSPPTEATGT